MIKPKRIEMAVPVGWGDITKGAKPDGFVRVKAELVGQSWAVHADVHHEPGWLVTFYRPGHKFSGGHLGPRWKSKAEAIKVAREAGRALSRVGGKPLGLSGWFKRALPKWQAAGTVYPC